MISDFYFKIPRRVKITIIFLLIVSAVYLLARFFTPEIKNVPEEFLRARQEASLMPKILLIFPARPPAISPLFRSLTERRNTATL